MMKRFCLFWGLMLLGWGGVASPSSAQGLAPYETVYAFLLDQMGRGDAALLEYNFEAVIWVDDSLGCPQDGLSYTEGEINGYRWSFLMDDGLRYALHSDGNAQNILICARNTQVAFTYSAYAGNLFSISHPNLWSARVLDNNSVSFNFRGAVACNLPEMRVFITEARPPSELLNLYFSSFDSAPDPGTYQPAGPNLTGLTTRYDAVCGDLTRRIQITAIPSASNAAFLILQTAPSGIFEGWSRAFVAMVGSFAPSGENLAGAGVEIASVVTPSAPVVSAPVVIAQATGLPNSETQSETASDESVSIPDFAAPRPAYPAPPPAPEVDPNSLPLAHVFVGDVYIGRLNDLPGQAITFDYDGGMRRSGLRVSQDGGQLAYIEDESKLYTVSMFDPDRPNLLADDVAAGYPPAWYMEGAALAYLRATDETDEGGYPLFEIVTIFPDGARDSPGSIPQEGDCPISERAAYTVEQLYKAETGRLFVWLPNNRFLYAKNCDGSGLEIFNVSTTIIVPLEADLHSGAVSPNGEILAAINDEGFVLLDLRSFESQVFFTSSPPQSLAWDITSTQVYYSASQADEPVIWNDPSTEAAARQVLGAFPFESRLNTLRLYQVDTQSGVEVQLWQGTGFGLGRMIGMPDGGGLLFTLIPSDRGLLTNFANAAEGQAIRNSLPETELRYLPIDFSGEAFNPPPAQLLAFTTQPRLVPHAPAP